MPTFLWGTMNELFKQYIDDLFFIWDGSESDFNDFTQYLNNNHYGITLTGLISSEKIDYEKIDVTFTTKDMDIISKTHFKEVDTNSLLDFKSAHYKKMAPKHTIWTILATAKKLRTLKHNPKSCPSASGKKITKHLLSKLQKIKQPNYPKQPAFYPTSRQETKHALKATI